MLIDHELASSVSDAVARYWNVRSGQQSRQRAAGRTDRGGRSAVTGGAQMDGFVDLFSSIIANTGIRKDCIYRKSTLLDLPGYFRPTKRWDLLVVNNGILLAALEFKSMVGPFFGNNANNRAEEAIGNAVDLWTAYREGAFAGGHQPFLGYFFLLEDCEASQKPVRTREPHFAVFPEFTNASYATRFELLCRKLVLERHYSAASLITSTHEGGSAGQYSEPASDLTVEGFTRALLAKVMAHVN